MSEINKIIKRQQKEKELILEQLKKVPIIQVACEKVGVGRATFYRWRKDDTDFADQVDMALTDGNQLVNDLAESQLMTAIRDNNMTAIIFWLKHHHPAYTTRIELTHMKPKDEKLTPEQEAIITKALELAGLPELLPVTDTKP